MFSPVADIFNIFYSNLVFLGQLDPGQIKFAQIEGSLSLAAILITIAVIKILLYRKKNKDGRSKHSFEGSGHLFFSRQGFFSKGLTVIAWSLFTLAIISGLVSLADPYILETREVKTVKGYKERAEVVDASVSMGFSFNGSGKSLAETAREDHLRFLKMRRGKNDRVTLWFFSTTYQRVEDFIADDEVYERQVADAPYIFADPNHAALPGSKFDPGDRTPNVIVPDARIHKASREGGTNAVSVLGAVINYFDKEGSGGFRNKALLLLTDAAVDEYPERELLDLKKRNIRPYVIYLDNSALYARSYSDEDKKRLENAGRLKKEIASFGGRYFDVKDRNSIRRAYQEIDRLEAVKIVEVGKIYRVYLFQYFLLLVLALLALSILFGLLSQSSGVDPYP